MLHNLLSGQNTIQNEYTLLYVMIQLKFNFLTKYMASNEDIRMSWYHVVVCACCCRHFMIEIELQEFGMK